MSAQVGASERCVRVGSLAFVNHGALPDWAREAVEQHTRQAEIVIWVGREEAAGDWRSGYIVLRDEINPSARAALDELVTAQMTPVMLSGDDARTTAAIAQALGLKHWEGSLTPADKRARIETWQAAGENVAMVGDGINDAPALAQADLSMTTMGGTDVAGETSDIVLMQPNLGLVPWFVRRSRRTRRIIYENLGWAFAYNIVAVPLAVFGVISPIIAAAAMATSSLLVVGNSLRLQR